MLGQFRGVATKLDVFVVCKIDIMIGCGETLTECVDGADGKDVQANHDTKEVICKLEVKRITKGRLFKYLVEVGMMAKINDEGVEVWTVCRLDIILEFVGHGEEPVVEFLL